MSKKARNPTRKRKRICRNSEQYMCFVFS